MSGRIVTIFGASGFLGRHVVRALAKEEPPAFLLRWTQEHGLLLRVSGPLLEALPGAARDLVRALQASGLVDLAGNVGVPAALTPGFHRDDVAPTLSGLEIRALATDGGVRPGSRFSHQPQFNAARIAFVVSDSAVQLGVSIDAAPLASCGLPQCSPAGAATLSSTTAASASRSATARRARFIKILIV